MCANIIGPLFQLVYILHDPYRDSFIQGKWHSDATEQILHFALLVYCHPLRKTFASQSWNISSKSFYHATDGLLLWLLARNSGFWHQDLLLYNLTWQKSLCRYYYLKKKQQHWDWAGLGSILVLCNFSWWVVNRWLFSPDKAVMAYQRKQLYSSLAWWTKWVIYRSTGEVLLTGT